MENKQEEQLTEEGRQAYNAYIREWRKRNKDKVKRYNSKYWNVTKAKALKEETRKEGATA